MSSIFSAPVSQQQQRRDRRSADAGNEAKLLDGHAFRRIASAAIGDYATVGNSGVLFHPANAETASDGRLRRRREPLG
jgi:hypothetical protein